MGHPETYLQRRYGGSAPTKTEWRDTLSPADRCELEAMLLEAQLKTQSGTEAERTRELIAGYRIVRDAHRSDMQAQPFNNIQTILRDKLVRATSEFTAFQVEAKTGKFPDAYVEAHTEELRAAVVGADTEVRNAMTTYAVQASKEARDLRAAHEAEREPARRLADEMEHARLVGSTRLDANLLFGKAVEMLDANQPARAKFLWEVVAEKGGLSPTNMVGAKAFESTLDTAIDASDPRLKDASAIEAKLAADSIEFSRTRTSALNDAGLGITRDGTVGTGASDVANASIQAKVEAFARKTETEAA